MASTGLCSGANEVAWLFAASAIPALRIDFPGAARVCWQTSLVDSVTLPADCAARNPGSCAELLKGALPLFSIWNQRALAYLYDFLFLAQRFL